MSDLKPLPRIDHEVCEQRIRLAEARLEEMVKLLVERDAIAPRTYYLQAAPSPLRDKLRGLVEEWRNTNANLNGAIRNQFYDKTLARCADRLAALLDADEKL